MLSGSNFFLVDDGIYNFTIEFPLFIKKYLEFKYYRTLVEALDVHNLFVLNTTTPTHFSFIGHNAWNLLDLVFVSSSYASICTSTITSEFLGSDHSILLTVVNGNTTPEDHGVAAIQRHLWSNPISWFSISLECAYCLFDTSVREAALEAIPQSKRSLKITFPWWNKQCDIAV